MQEKGEYNEFTDVEEISKTIKSLNFRGSLSYN